MHKHTCTVKLLGKSEHNQNSKSMLMPLHM